MLDTLIQQRIVLLDPSTWHDRNDREMMAAYASAVPDRRVFAYCLAEGRETAHHWQIFADGGRGARINFHQDRLMTALKAHPEIRQGFVSYVDWRTLDTSTALDTFPFIKRKVFRYEREYRVIATMAGVPDDSISHELPVPLNCITSVYISGELPTPYFNTLKALINRTPGCERLPVRHSGLLRNDNWDRAIAKRLSP